ncbi:hypothetical protein PGB90_005570 [Kerria lacca]
MEDSDVELLIEKVKNSELMWNIRTKKLIILLRNFSSKEQPGRRVGSCRVCLKSFKPEDYSRICFGCKMKVCEDCASYSQQGENEDEDIERNRYKGQSEGKRLDKKYE